jgi:tetratricopeptide (TPR) repeat protein
LIHVQPCEDKLWALRDALARRLRRNLRDDDWEPHLWTGRTLPPQVVADVLAGVEVSSSRDVSKVRALVEGAGNEVAASFDELVKRMAFRIVLGEVHWSPVFQRAIQTGTDPALAALKPLLEISHKPSVRITDRVRAVLGTSECAEGRKLTEAETDDERFEALRTFASRAIAPGWVSARLWERRPRDGTAVMWWHERNLLLRGEAPDLHWNSGLAESLADAILDAIQAEPDLLGWYEERQRLAAARTVPSASPPSDQFIDPVPGDLLGRLDWISDLVSHSQSEVIGPRESIRALIPVVLRAMARSSVRDVPHPQVARLVALARERPVVVIGLSWSLREHPHVLADLLFEPDFSAWSVDRIADWSLRPAPLGPQELEQHADQRLGGCFESSVDVACATWLREPQKGGPGLAWTIKRLHGRRGWYENEADERARRRRLALWSVLSKRAAEPSTAYSELVESALAATLGETTRSGFASPWFNAALELVREAGFLVAPERRADVRRALQNAYASFIESEDAHEPLGLEPLLAATFVHEMLAGSVARPAFHEPALIREEVQRLHRKQHPLFAVRAKLRTHIRLLARAVEGSGAGGVRAELYEALRRALVSGVCERPQDGLLDAFDAGEESRDGGAFSLAADVAGAVNCLPVDERGQIMSVLARVDEPLAVATFARLLTGNARNVVRQAAAAVVERAPQVYSLSEAWARIDALLNAELYDAAELALRDEQKLPKTGEFIDRTRLRFIARLRLYFGRGKYEELLAETVPEATPRGGDDDPRHVLKFYKALAEFDRKDGVLENAERWFRELHERFPNLRTYAENLQAVRIRRVLDAEDNWPVGADRRDAVAGVLAEGEALMAPFPPDATYLGNKAILLMALGQYERVISGLGADAALLWTSDKLLGLRVRALVRVGRSAEAEALFQRVIEEFGETADLEEARAELGGGKKAPRVSRQTNPTSTQALRVGYLELRAQTPTDQARVVGDTELTTYLWNSVLAACSWVVELLPTMELKSPGNGVPWEEAINLLMAKILNGIFDPLGWSVDPEDPSGPTPSKWGSTDLAVKKGNIAILRSEAQRVKDRGSWKADARAHIGQLRSKSMTCDIGFHLLWSFSSDPKRVVKHLRKLVEEDAKVIPMDEGNAVCKGFASVLDHGGFRPFWVGHLVVDMTRGLAVGMTDGPVEAGGAPP